MLDCLYVECPDLFYLICTYLVPKDLLALSSVNRNCRRIIYWCEYRNLWQEWWSRHVSSTYVPSTEMQGETLRAMRYQSQPDQMILLGYDRMFSTSFRTYSMPKRQYLLEIALEHNQSLFIEMLLDAGVPSHIPMSWSSVITSGNLTLSRRLIEAYPIQSVKLLNQCLCYAVRTSQIEIMEYLVKRGADGLSYCLLDAVFYDQVKAVKFLIEHGADITANNYEVFSDACRYGNLEIIRYLLNSGAQVSVNKYDGFVQAIFYNRAEVMRLLFETDPQLCLQFDLCHEALDYARRNRIPAVIDVVTKYTVLN